MAREFDVRREVVLPGTPEAVWEAISTPDGQAAWLFPSDVGEEQPFVRTWDPPQHLVIRMEQGEWFNALEFELAGRDDATTTLRYVHSGILVDDWDNQYDAINQHTDFYLHTLGEYLAHFDGRPCQYIGDVPGGLQGPPRSMEPDGFHRLRAALGLPAGTMAGDAVALHPAGVPALEGVADYVATNFLGIRTPTALYRFFGRNAFGGPVGMSIHLFDPSTDAAALRTQWQEWLTRELA